MSRNSLIEIESGRNISIATSYDFPNQTNLSKLMKFLLVLWIEHDQQSSNH